MRHVKPVVVAAILIWLALAFVALVPQQAMAQTQVLYGCLGSILPPNLHEINQTSASPTVIGLMGPTNRFCSSLDFDTGGVLWTVLNTQTNPSVSFTYTVNTITGAATQVSQMDSSGGFSPYSDISFRPSDGTLFALRVGPGSSRSLATVNPNTGQVTILGTTGVLGTGNGIAFSGSSVLFFATHVGLYTLNQNSGLASLVATFSFSLCGGAGTGRVNAMDFDEVGQLWGVINCLSSANDHLVRINTSTAVFTNIGILGINTDGLAFSVSPIFPSSICNINSAVPGLSLTALFVILIGIGLLAALIVGLGMKRIGFMSVQSLSGGSASKMVVLIIGLIVVAVVAGAVVQEFAC